MREQNTLCQADGGIDLVRLALALVGSTVIDEILARSLRLLDGWKSGTAWSLLHRIGPRRYRAAGGCGVGHEHLRAMADLACGPKTWLALGHIGGSSTVVGQAEWIALEAEDETAGGPSLVLGWWQQDDRPKLTSAQRAGLDTAARLIASAADAAMVFECLQEQTSRDSLTGLLNRRGILEILRRENANAARGGGELAVLFLDVDRFKEINDRYGHAIGDDVLCAVGQSFADGLRVSDSVGRLGGDEFLIVLPDTTLSAARRIGQRLAREIATKGVTTARGRLVVEVSHGCAAVEERLGLTALVEKADRRMLARKRRHHQRTPHLVREALKAAAGSAASAENTR